ncbi:hypothetical protein KAU88_09915 [Candidatus Bathyarchaeota archaeon]|nr:hypothetical protein [Candidatus Bathyarchaeota archaeon]
MGFHRRLQLLRKKEEIRMRIATLAVEEAMTCFEKRKELFSNEKKLLEFVQKVMPIVNPQLWEEFNVYCEEQGYDLANAVATSLGEQKYFEDQLAEGSPSRMDSYLEAQLKESLEVWKEVPSQEEEEYTEDNENDECEIITIPLYY